MTDWTTRREFLHRSTGAVAAMALAPDLSAGPALEPGESVTIGVVGTGRQGRAILAELQKIEGARVVAICDTDDRRLSSGLRRIRGAKGYADYHDLLASEKDLQACIVATPTHLHRPVVHAALAAGRHVYCEAPMASTVEDCAAIVSAARATDRLVCQVGMLGRSNPIYKLASSFARSGAIRDLVSMRAQHHRKTSWRTPATDPQREQRLNWRLDPALSIGLAGEFGTHQFDVMHWFSRMYPISVRGSGSIRLHDDGRDIYDTISLELSFPGGLTMHYGATLANSYEGTYEQVAGTMGLIKLAWSHGWLFKEADAPTQGWEVYANRQQFHGEEGITLIADATQLASQGKLKDGIGLPNPPLYYGLEDFLRSITGRTRIACTVEEGMRAAIVGIRANEAVLSGTDVAISLDVHGEQ